MPIWEGIEAWLVSRISCLKVLKSFVVKAGIFLLFMLNEGSDSNPTNINLAKKEGRVYLGFSLVEMFCFCRLRDTRIFSFFSNFRMSIKNRKR